jgi:hypothetical protein
MKRVLTLAITGLFMTGLAVLPISARADQTVTGAKSVTSTPAASGVTTTAPVKKDDKKVSATPSVTAPATSGTMAKTPGAS